NLRECIAWTLKPLDVLARRKGLEIVTTFEHGTPEEIVGDAQRLGQVLTNIIGNAVKFSERGRVEAVIGPSAARLADGRERLRFAIRDQGPGIPAGKLGSIFESFVQAPDQTRLKHGGTGLGLAIAKNLVESMGGSIRVESALGKGSEFVFTAVFGQASSERGKEAAGGGIPSGTAKPLNILLAEDNPVNQIYMRELLGRMNHKVTTAVNGADALRKLSGEKFDLVLMDVLMPEMDGLEALRRIRGGEAGDPNIPVVALTAHSLRGDRENLLAAGMDGYISKPVDINNLWVMLNRFGRMA
ncbi:MAG: response regulator, partial [Thermodesulfobacteriota bacterium]